MGREEPAGFACFVIGALSIAAVPPFGAFWSKDHIAAAAEAHPAWFVLVLVAAAGSAAYLLRPALVLWRPGPHAPRRRPIAGRRAMIAGAAGLAVASLVLGAIGGPLARLVGGALPSSTRSLVLSLLALLAGAAVVLVGRAPGWVALAARRELFTNELLEVAVRRPLLALARLSDRLDRRVVDAAVDGTAHATLALAAASDQIERRGIDAAVDGLAELIGAGGGRLRRLQTGRLYEYLRDTALGTAAVGVLIALSALL